MWDFACLSLEISIQLFFFPFLFSSSVLFLVSSPSLHPRSRVREGSDYMCSMYLCFCCLFLLIFFCHIDNTLLRRWVVPQNSILLYFILAGNAKCLVNVLICPFLDHTKSSHYYWPSGSFKVTYYYYHYYYIPCKFFTLAVTDGFSLESGWQQISLGLQDSY